LRLFPKDFEDIKLEKVKSDLEKLEHDEHDREEVSKLILRLRSHFPKQKLDNVVKLAKDLYAKVNDAIVIEMLTHKESVFSGAFSDLTADKLRENL